MPRDVICNKTYLFMIVTDQKKYLGSISWGRWEDCQRINYPFWSLINHNLAAQLIGSNASSPTILSPVSFLAFVHLSVIPSFSSSNRNSMKQTQIIFFLFGSRQNEFELNCFFSLASVKSSSFHFCQKFSCHAVSSKNFKLNKVASCDELSGRVVNFRGYLTFGNL